MRQNSPDIQRYQECCNNNTITIGFFTFSMMRFKFSVIYVPFLAILFILIPLDISILRDSKSINLKSRRNGTLNKITDQIQTNLTSNFHVRANYLYALCLPEIMETKNKKISGYGCGYG